MIEKLIIGPDRYNCPVCGVEWYESDLDSIGDLGCPSCRRKFDLEDFMYEGEPRWHNWREKCYHRMVQDRENGGKI